MATYTTAFLTTVTSHAVATATTTIVAALPAPSGYHVNFDDPARKGDVTGYWVFAIGIVVAFLFLLMRLYTKVFISGSFVIDDGELESVFLFLDCALTFYSMHRFLFRKPSVVNSQPSFL